MTDEDMEYAIHAWDYAVTFLLNKFWTIEVEWDLHHVIQHGENFTLIGCGQDVQTLHMATIGYYWDGIGYCNQGSSYMMVVVISDPIESYSIKPLRQSEDPQLQHYADLTNLFSQDRYKLAWFALDIEKIQNLQRY